MRTRTNILQYPKFVRWSILEADTLRPLKIGRARSHQEAKRQAAAWHKKEGLEFNSRRGLRPVYDAA